MAFRSRLTVGQFEDMLLNTYTIFYIMVPHEDKPLLSESVRFSARHIGVHCYIYR